MAIEWQTKQDGRRYELRRAGKTRRIYTDGVCHTEYNPGKIITGSIWDLLTIPAFFYPPGSIQRVLILGVGGGAAILQLKALLDIDEITGIEIDPVHIYMARKFFHLDTEKINIHEQDALTWLNNYDDLPFDMIIDDLFTGIKRNPVRAIPIDKHWLNLIYNNISEHGVLTINFVSLEEFNDAAALIKDEYANYFTNIFRLSTPSLDNRVGVFTRANTDSSSLRKNLSSHQITGPALTSGRLKYRISRCK